MNVAYFDMAFLNQRIVLARHIVDRANYGIIYNMMTNHSAVNRQMSSVVIDPIIIMDYT